jgi:uncharacterized protein (DUF1330 family)
MSYYFIAQIKINDPETYRKYIDKVDSIFVKSKGKYLVLDNNPEVLEGTWDYTRSVVIRFDTKADFESWYRSPEYQEILKYRLQAAQCDTILVKGK